MDAGRRASTSVGCQKVLLKMPRVYHMQQIGAAILTIESLVAMVLESGG